MADQDLDNFAATTAIEDTDLIVVYKKSSDSIYRKMTGASLKALFLSPASTSASVTLAFDTWRTPNANRSVLVTVEVNAATNGSSDGVINFLVDESGGTTKDYEFELSRADNILGNGGTIRATTTLYVPAGSSYQIENAADPTATNSIVLIREHTL